MIAQLGLFAIFFLCRGTSVNWLSPAVLILVLAIGLFVAAALALGNSLSPFPAPVAGGDLITHGVFGWIRHPIYVGVVSAALALSIMTHSLSRGALTLVIALFFDAKARAEERLLLSAYPSYARYAARTRKFVPWLY